MANLITISENWGICPVCLYNALETAELIHSHQRKK